MEFWIKLYSIFKINYFKRKLVRSILRRLEVLIVELNTINMIPIEDKARDILKLQDTPLEHHHIAFNNLADVVGLVYMESSLDLLKSITSGARNGGTNTTGLTFIKTNTNTENWISSVDNIFEITDSVNEILRVMILYKQDCTSVENVDDYNRFTEINDMVIRFSNRREFGYLLNDYVFLLRVYYTSLLTN